MNIRCVGKGNQGMTLVEVVMATGILTIVAGALIGTYNCGFFVMQSVRENQRATQILMEKVETIRLYSWSQVNTPNFIPATFSDYYDPQSAQGSQGVRYDGEIEISDFPFNTSYSTNLKQIEVTLTWKSRGNTTHTRKASTFIAKDGVQNYVY
ncbi:MAG: prepilin-type N-terminal cleavage/methylation domain-containing protein [Verrucomicrobia bacterium]|nr:prepilin-type N-terminal cleavage/methylation domain-containing protein [Verrucomicrobiota bacterium]